MDEFLVGVDEAGRGPLAGPVSVGIVKIPAGFDVGREFPGVKDSKQLTEKKREEIYEELVLRTAAGHLAFAVRFSDALYIDTFGITKAVRRGITLGVQHLVPHAHNVHIMLDGLLKAPKKYSQTTVIHGDDLVPIISLASVAAKVERDRVMTTLAQFYPQYNFDEHKGYGTPKHLAALRLYGLCAIHRRTYCKSALVDTSIEVGVGLIPS